MKNVVTLLCVILIIYSCKNSSKDISTSKDISKYIHPIDKPYDSSANILKEEKYIEKNILQIIQELGPMSFRKENNIWYMYSLNVLLLFTQEADLNYLECHLTVFTISNLKQMKLKNIFFILTL